MHAALLSLLLASAAPLKLAVMPLTTGEGVGDKAAGTITEAVAAEVRRVPGTHVITREEIAALLNLEMQKQMTGCASDSCIAEIGGALGVDRIVTGSIGRLGESWLVHLKAIDPAKPGATKQSDRRLRGGTVDDVLDALPAMVAELFPGAPGTAAVAPSVPAPPAVPAIPATPAAPLPKPVPWAEKALDLAAADLDALELVTDGKGGYVAFKRGSGSDGPLLAGDAKRLFAQRITGSGSEGYGKVRFDYVFWEPRVKERWRGSFEFRDNAYTLFCGDKKIAFQPVPAAEATKILKAAQLFQPRWQRRMQALARDEDGRYYYVDCAREPDEPTDCRMFVGTKGRTQYVPLDDVMIDEGGGLYVSAAGKLRLAADGKSGEWKTAAGAVKVVPMDIYMSAPLVYTTLGVYAGEKLGSACDDRL